MIWNGARSNDILVLILTLLPTAFSKISDDFKFEGKERNEDTERAFRRRDYYVSQDDMRELVDMEKDILTQLPTFHRYMREQLKLSEWMMKSVIAEVDKLKGKEQEYTINPIAGFLILKRFHNQWRNMQEIITEYMELGLLGMNEAFAPGEELPQERDVLGAALGLVRLQEWYELETEDVANGLLENVQHPTSLNAQDCLDLAELIWDIKPYYAIEWADQALHKSGPEDHRMRVAVHELRARVLYYSEGAESMAYDIIALRMTDPKYDVDALKSKIRKNKPDGDRLIPMEDGDKTENQEACRGVYDLTPEESTLLKCRYHFGDPYLKIGPIKVEDIHHDPPISIFHNILTEREIEWFKILTKKGMTRARVLDEENGSVTSENRLSKDAGLDQTTEPTVAQVYKRIEAITGLDTNSSEILVGQNYGIGGYQDGHYDYLGVAEADPENTPWPKEEGDRIVTMLVYLSDVQGGATAFTSLGVRMKPERGSALFWHNIRRNGTVDPRTLHCGCPVISGSKWVLNVWLHERGQEFRLPCKLENV